MVAHSIIVLIAFFTCILGPITLAVQMRKDPKEVEKLIDHHFLKG